MCFFLRPAYDGAKRTIFIVHGWLGGRNNAWLHTFKDEMLIEVNNSMISKLQVHLEVMMRIS